MRAPPENARKQQEATQKNTAEKDTFCIYFLSKSQTWYRRSQARYSVASLLTSTQGVYTAPAERMIYNFCEIDDIPCDARMIYNACALI